MDICEKRKVCEMDEGKSVKTGVGERRGRMVGMREKKLDAAEGEEVGSGGERRSWKRWRERRGLRGWVWRFEDGLLRSKDYGELFLACVFGTS